MVNPFSVHIHIESLYVFFLISNVCVCDEFVFASAFVQTHTLTCSYHSHSNDIQSVVLSYSPTHEKEIDYKQHFRHVRTTQHTVAEYMQKDGNVRH